jgi:hypothetical protein
MCAQTDETKTPGKEAARALTVDDQPGQEAALDRAGGAAKGKAMEAAESLHALIDQARGKTKRAHNKRGSDN